MANEMRLIDANALIVKMCRACNNECCEDPCEPGECFMYDAISNAPTVDAVEVVHGHWCWEGRFKACSVCGSYIDWDDTLGANHWSYCPYCGAKMDGDGNGNL